MFLNCEPKLLSWYSDEAMGWIFKNLWFSSSRARDVSLVQNVEVSSFAQLVLGAFSLEENSRGFFTGGKQQGLFHWRKTAGA